MYQVTEYAMTRRTLASLLAVLIAAGLILAAYMGAPSGNSSLRVSPNRGHPGRYFTRFETMGTTAHLEVVADSQAGAEKMLTPAAEAVRQVDRLMSTYRPDSDISRLNGKGSAGPVEVDPHVLAVLRKAVDLCRLSHGAFDVTSGPLRDLWRDAQKKDKAPSEAELERALERVGCDRLSLGDDTAQFTTDGVEVDLGGIAKGYAIDRAVQEIRAQGGSGALADIGGDMRLLGRRADGGRWKIRVRTPPRIDLDEPVYLKIDGAAVATSGDYARYYRIGGERYSHIVDPRTGQPVRSVPSCTVIAPTAMTADGLATAISVLGPDEGLRMVEKVEGAECLIMAQREDGLHLVSSDGFSDYRYYPAENDGDTE